MTDTADLFIRIGFVPDIVRLTNLYDGKELLWSRAEHGHYQGATATGGIATTVGGTSALFLPTGGIALCDFTGGTAPIDYISDPATVDGTNWIDANGIKISSSVDLLTSDQLMLIEAWRMNHILLKAYHDGTTNSNTYFEDNSYDFKDLGVSGNGKWLIYNQTNGNYAYVKEVRKKNLKTKWSQIYTAIDSKGTPTSAADFDTADVCYIFPINAAPFPMSDVAMMT